MRILRFFRFYAAILAAAFCTACADEDFTDSPTDSGEAVSLTSTKLHVITRAGDEIETFYPGTVYRLFAVQHAVQEADYKWSAGIKSDGDAAIMYGMTGRESEDHDIVYNDGVNFNYATGSNADCLDFFAITVDNVDKDHHFEEKLPKFDSLVRVNGVSPTVEWEVGQCSAVSTQPGDLMFSNDQKQKSYQDGAVTMNFRHALTRFTFQAAVQDESDYTDKWLEDNVTLTGIEVHGTHDAGTFNICTGTWSYTTGSNTEIAACDTEKLGQKLTTSAADVGESLLIFPNNDEVLEMVVKLHFKTKPEGQAFSSNTERVSVTEVAGGGYDVTVTTPLTLGEVENVTDAAQKDKAVEFASNYSYLFSIVVMRNDVRVLAIVPTVYNWMDDELTYETVVGQPVTFGGLMWMDRNLGASTWDAENDFYGSIGYYYQYGRNIPYILDTTKWVIYADDNDVDDMIANSTNNHGYCVIKPTNQGETKETSPYYAWYSHGKPLTTEIKTMLKRYQVECFYTYYSTGTLDTVQGYTYIESETEQQPFRYVGQAIYNTDGTMDKELTKKYHRFSVIKEYNTQYDRWTYSDNYAQTYWSADVDDQPCPKGWRLPNRVDFYEFMPWTCNSETSGNGYIVWTSDWRLAKTNISGTNYYHPGWYQDIYYGQRTNTDGSTYNVAYMLYRNAKLAKDATSAYRIRIKTNFSKGITEEYKAKNQYSTNKRYITIDRYTADPTRELSDYFETESPYNEKESDWDTPVETMIYPCAGFIVTDKTYFDLRTFGTGSVLRTDEANKSDTGEGVSWVQYLSRSNMNVSINSRSRRSLGDQVRCCRDLTATK